MRRPLALVILLAGSMLAMPVAPSTAGTSTGIDAARFSPPERVLAGSFSDVAMVVDSGGSIHATLSDQEALWYLTDRRGRWQGRVVLEHPADMRYHAPSIALDENDRITIAVARQTCLECSPGAEAGVVMVTDRGRTRGTFPSTPEQVAPWGTTAPSIKTVGGRVYLAYAVCVCQPAQPSAAVSVAVRSRSGAWTRSELADYGWDPSLRVGDDALARVAFGSQDGIQYATARSLTGDFDVLDVPGREDPWSDTAPSLSLDSMDRPHIAWLRTLDPHPERAVLYSRVTAAGWTDPGVVGAGRYHALALSLDAADRPHILAGGVGIAEYLLGTGKEWRVRLTDADVQVDALGLRASSVGTIAMWVGRSASEPVGVYVARD